MVIISDYDVIAMGESEFFCESFENPTCPCCSGDLVYRDQRRRIMRTYGGERSYIRLRRLRCPACRRIHLELPDCLVPRKHYALEVIENVIDGVSTPEDESTEDYPCESTMHRWQFWMSFNISQIDGWLKSVGQRVLELGNELLAATESLVGKLRDKGAGWLAVCTRAVYNAGGAFLTKPPSGLCTCFV